MRTASIGGSGFPGRRFVSSKQYDAARCSRCFLLALNRHSKRTWGCPLSGKADKAFASYLAVVTRDRVGRRSLRFARQKMFRRCDLSSSLPPAGGGTFPSRRSRRAVHKAQRVVGFEVYLVDACTSRSACFSRLRTRST